MEARRGAAAGLAPAPERERAEIVASVQPALVVTEPIAPDADASDEPIVPDRVAPSFKAPTSGGSTGRPKIIVSEMDGAIDVDAHPYQFADRRPGQTELVPGPLYHNGPFVFSTPTLLTGGHVVVMTRFDASEALRLIEAHRVEWAMLVPTMMLRIWRLPEEERLGRDLSSWRAFLHVAAPCPAWLKHEWIGWLGPDRIWELYSGTEAQGSTLINGRDWLAHEGSVGRPRPGTMKVTDADGNDLPPGEVGEIWMKPPEVPTYHYIGAEARVRDGWESLGDLGWTDEEGYLYLADRRTDLIIAGGANIYPAEVEAALMEHPAIASCAVIGLPRRGPRAPGACGARVHRRSHRRRVARVPRGAVGALQGAEDFRAGRGPGSRRRRQGAPHRAGRRASGRAERAEGGSDMSETWETVGMQEVKPGDRVATATTSSRSRASTRTSSAASRWCASSKTSPRVGWRTPARRTARSRCCARRDRHAGVDRE